MRIHHYQRGQIVKDVILIGIITAIIFWLIGNLGVMSLDQEADNSLEMLCESAQKSGNEQWLENCDKYYETGNPMDIQTK